MSDTSDERVIGYAKWNESEARSLRLHCTDSPSMPELAEMHEETAATLRKLMAERNALRIALMPFALAAPLDLIPEMDDQYVDSSSDMFYDLTYGYFRKARIALGKDRQ